MSDDNIDVFEQIERIAVLIRSEEQKKCAQLGLQSVHLQVLKYLYKCNKVSDTPAALANYLGMTRGTVSQTLNLLEKKGYIAKTEDSKDRRVVHLSLTQDGQHTLEQAKPAELFIKASQFIKNIKNIGDFAADLDATLTALQKANNAQSYGVCSTCHYFTEADDKLLCGLFKQTLSDADVNKICLEHTVVLWWR